MRHCNQGRCRQQVQFLLRQFAQDGCPPNFARTKAMLDPNARPDFTTVRETRIRVKHPGFRTKSIVVVTTLLDPQRTTAPGCLRRRGRRWVQDRARRPGLRDVLTISPATERVEAGYARQDVSRHPCGRCRPAG